MKIDCIFADKLFAFHYNDEKENEYDRNIELWTDPSYLLEFAKENTLNVNHNQYVKDRLEDAEQIIDLIEEICIEETEYLDIFFERLSVNDYSVILSLRKGKTKQIKRRNDLRLYAIRIDQNCFVITGGAIKVSQTMQENELTLNELDKLKMCQQYLKDNGVFDRDSFIDLLNS